MDESKPASAQHACMDNLELNYPKELPVCEHREEILAALQKNPVVIVCGDTGSGKTDRKSVV